MADTEVENILREIRERVYAEQAALEHSSANNGAEVAPANGVTRAGEPLARLESYLTTTSRAWDRLPPVVSNRSGAIARAELWLKQNLKRATRWYAWEQINFNAAVHHALHDLIEIISSQEQALAELREELKQVRADNAAALTNGQQQQSAIEAIRSNTAAQRATIEAQQRLLADQRAVVESLSATLKGRDTEVDRRLESLSNEMRERAQALQDEQRVAYRQLSLETREAAALEERARRKLDTLLEELQANKPE
jgi:chromosome segregation ATPase